jgi:hypothetical protein
MSGAIHHYIFNLQTFQDINNIISQSLPLSSGCARPDVGDAKQYISFTLSRELVEQSNGRRVNTFEPSMLRLSLS